GEAWITSATLRLEPLGPLPGLRANGNLLEAGEETVIFKPTEIIPGARAAPDGPILEFRTDLAAPPGRARPTAADWIAAASEAVRSGKYSAARIVIGTQFDDLGIAPRDVALYLTGLIRLLQSRSGLQVALDLEPLRQAEPTPRNHALLASCLEASAAIRDHDGSLPAQDLPKNR
ncbi:hypothetical protein HQ520_08160, partial [bacterium]|nr:hypothetical protein [bacterium]